MRRVHGDYRRGGARYRVAVAEDSRGLLRERGRDIGARRGRERRHFGRRDKRRGRHAVHR